MPNPVDPIRTSATKFASPLSGGTGTFNLGPAAVAGEIGALGAFRLLKQLGAGGMGAVYLALDTRLNRKVALKLMLPELAADTDAKERFLREARAVAQITHDHVVTVYEADERDGVPYIAMQFLQGRPLDKYLNAKGPLPLPHVIRIARETALGLAAAHQLGLVHRDIKPANLWLEAPHGRVKVLDFGLVRVVDADAELTKSGAVVGTPAYMSPEQARGLKVDARTDLFSLGAVLYRLCTGKNPFTGESVMAVLAALLTDEPVPVGDCNPNVPEPLAQLIHQLMAKNPEDRPRTAAEVAKRLRAIQDQLAPSAVAEPPIPMVTADDSDSQPAVRAVPVQPPIAVPLPVSLEPPRAFVHPESGDATEEEAAADASKRKKPGAKGVLVSAGVVGLLVLIAATIVVLQTGGKKGPEVNGPQGAAQGAAPQGAAPEHTSVTKVGPVGETPSGGLPPTYRNSLGMEFVKVPKGKGWLGGGGGRPGETPVEIDRDFYLGKYEVTQGEWEAVTGANPSHFTKSDQYGRHAVRDFSEADLKRFPVERVSWDDCQLFIKRLNDKQKEKEPGWVYRLPKEAEWEYACRGGSADKLESAFDFYFAKPTTTLRPEQAQFATGEPRKEEQIRPCKVGSYEPNSLGLYDMHGGVMEWCQDAENAPDGLSHRVYRGGHFNDLPSECRAASRRTYLPSTRHFGLGLRLARVRSAPTGE